MDVVQAYLDITEKYGPSEQLLSFIDYDNTLPYELGLESFNSLSLQTRHEVLSMKLKSIGTESLFGFLGSLFSDVKKIQSYTSKFAEETHIGHLPINDIINHGVCFSKNADKIQTDIFSYPEVVSYISDIDYKFKPIEIYYKHLPSDFSLSSWELCLEKATKEVQIHVDNWEHFSNSSEKYHSHKSDGIEHDSGWTENRFRQAVKSWVESVHKEKTLIENLNKKLFSIKTGLDENKSDSENSQAINVISKYFKRLNVSKLANDKSIERAYFYLSHTAKLFDINHR